MSLSSRLHTDIRSGVLEGVQGKAVKGCQQYSRPGYPNFQSLTCLRALMGRHNAISDAGQAGIRRALPGICIHF